MSYYSSELVTPEGREFQPLGDGSEVWCCQRKCEPISRVCIDCSTRRVDSWIFSTTLTRTVTSVRKPLRIKYNKESHIVVQYLKSKENNSSIKESPCFQKSESYLQPSFCVGWPWKLDDLSPQIHPKTQLCGSGLRGVNAKAFRPPLQSLTNRNSCLGR